MKQLVALTAIVLFSLPAFSQFPWGKIQQNTTFGGYVIGQATATDKSGADKKADMGVRLIRVYADSKIGDFAFKLQMQLNGNVSDLNKSPRIVDAWAEWRRWPELRVRFGQMKRCFTFENPMHPWLLGRGNYSQLSTKMAGFSDRTGEHSSNGRDFGAQIYGDLFPFGEKHNRFLHYQVGVYNGQGLNFYDKNTRKDVMGGLWISPVKGLQIGGFAWNGNYVNNAGQTIDRERYSAGVNYTGIWSARAEYAIDEANGKADAWYAIVGTPEWYRTKVFLYYDVYREAKNFDNSTSIYGASIQHMLDKNLMFQFNYGFNHANTEGASQNYNTFDLQLYWRF